MQLTKRTKIIWGILLFLLLAFAGLLWMERTPTPLPPVPGDVAVRKKAAPATAKKKDNTEQDATAPSRPEAPSAPGMAAVPITAGNLGKISKLRNTLEEETLEVQIEEKRARKRELTRSGSLPAPTLSLPSLTPPASPSPVSPAVPRPAGTGGLRVISVQGVGGQLTATVRTGSGQVVVRKGSRLGGGVVTGISRQAVTIRRGNQSSALPFE
ncbi:hypothetical protein [Desulfovibrio sp. ZJ200]|uniref:hypothetical protein n=1 Tax=Desulfovibrio sp. ZJ200 TaxID=2709792 RepID=UPI0013EE1A6F|nr:hypothetical protein [Desulfovibrio sp. ZJ200]